MVIATGGSYFDLQGLNKRWDHIQFHIKNNQFSTEQSGYIGIILLETMYYHFVFNLVD